MLGQFDVVGAHPVQGAPRTPPSSSTICTALRSRARPRSPRRRSSRPRTEPLGSGTAVCRPSPATDRTAASATRHCRAPSSSTSSQSAPTSTSTPATLPAPPQARTSRSPASRAAGRRSPARPPRLAPARPTRRARQPSPRPRTAPPGRRTTAATASPTSAVSLDPFEHLRLDAFACFSAHSPNQEVDMSTRRLLMTVAVMTAIAVALTRLTPGPAAMGSAVAAGQRTVDTQGPDALISAAAGLLAWAVWAWGALGLALTAASALPGMAGGAARLALRVALPAGARHSAALLLGIGLGLTAPLATAVLPALTTSASAADGDPRMSPTGLRRHPPSARCPTGPAARHPAETRRPPRRPRRLPLAHRGRLPAGATGPAAERPRGRGGGRRLVARQRRRHRPRSGPADPRPTAARAHPVTRARPSLDPVMTRRPR